MRRPVTFRQIEAFKAVIEQGTISRAAAVLHVTQPGMSKIIANLEADTGLVLFDRINGRRLVPSPQGMRLYEEVDRIFAGMQQVESAIDAVLREDQGRIAIGAMPVLSGNFVQRATMEFLQRRPQAFCVVESRTSPHIMEWLANRKLDVGLVEPGINNPRIVSEPLMQHPLVCILPTGHALAAKTVVRAAHLDGLPFVAYTPEGVLGPRIAAIFAEQGIRLNTVLIAAMASTVCEFVAAGRGISLVHPVAALGFGDRLVVRAFEPAIPFSFRLCYSRDNRNTRLITDFVEAARNTARSFLP
jgi:DNA-binding transcriptional LysR family regulator